jgi:diguanylate cyclase (GGDEF)-like protein/PAS domain S-box-containing protein
MKNQSGIINTLGAVTIIAVAAIVWAVVAGFTLHERDNTVERARHQLYNIVSTLADYSAAAELPVEGGSNSAAPDRTEALWNVLLQYPTATIWMDRNDVLFSGQPSTGPATDFIIVSASSGPITAHAALPKSDVLAEWRKTAWERGAALLIATIGFIGLSMFLRNAMRRRAAAEQDAAVAGERVSQMARYQAQLEGTVAQRTQELHEANGELQTELTERKAAEELLRQHDALLNAVTRSAAELLGSRNLGDAVAVVFELMGQATSVGRVQLSTIRSDSDGHLRTTVRYEWCAPGLSPLIDNAALQDLDVTEQFPNIIGAAVIGDIKPLFVEDIKPPLRAIFEAAQMRSALFVPVMSDGKATAVLSFIDSASRKREWNWAETDALKTLAGLISNATDRARYISELADANTIVQNSPTVLFRLKGEPGLPLMYISPNLAKFGLDPAKVLVSSDGFKALIDPEDQSKVGAALEHMLDKGATAATIEFRLIRGDGARRWIEARCSPIRDNNGRLVEVEGIMIDVTERKAAEDKIFQLARTDGLTGLANRSTFIERLNQAFLASKRGEPSCAVLYLDLDRFKDINDTLGHPIGDLLLKASAERLVSVARETDLVARLGGDEFAVLQTDTADAASAGALAAKIRTILAEPYLIEGNELHITASIGIAPLSKETPSPEVLLSQADLALYRAKEEGRNQYRFHTESLDVEVRERVSLADDLRQAIEDEELESYYQPQVDLASGLIVGMELLVRWNHPTRGLIMPGEFIPIAEKTGTILVLGRWVLDQACRQMRLWRDAGIAPPLIAVNVSLIQLRNAKEFIADVTQCLEKWDLDPGDLELDVTESTLARVGWAQNDVLARLRKMGVKIALDDFGTDYSSFDYVRTYNVNHLKIARSFIEMAAGDPNGAATIRAINGFARELGVDVIAEGVETAEQRALLLSLGNSGAQGFYFSEAVQEDKATDLLRERASLPHGPQPAVAPAPKPVIPTKSRARGPVRRPRAPAPAPAPAGRKALQTKQTKEFS